LWGFTPREMPLTTKAGEQPGKTTASLPQIVRRGGGAAGRRHIRRQRAIIVSIRRTWIAFYPDDIDSGLLSG